MNEKDLCLGLIRANSEKEVIEILQRAGYWDDLSAWRNLGDMENNFSVVGNQQSKPDAALVEKLINSVDAILMGEAQIRELTPESERCPQSIAEAVELFFEVPDGKLTRISPTKRTDLSKQIALVATGTRQNPCYSIIDRGEGQTPNKMPSTFLSIVKESNKLKIPYVQGKFNMGGTGVLQFGSYNNLQLIVSKRNPDIARHENDDSKEKWGFTIVRRVNPTHDVRSSVYKYLAPGNHILSFNTDSLPILPGKGSLDAYTEDMDYGSFIKLYEYKMPGLLTAVTVDLSYRLALLLPSLALPIRLYERRSPPYTVHSPETTLSGLMVRLDEDRANNIEKEFPTSHTFVVQGQTMKASVYLFKPGKELNYKKDEGIIFTLNGQTHASIDKRFFTRQKVGMGFLKDSILVIVDCTNIDGRAREDLFMNSRDRMRSKELTYDIEKELENIIREHPGLKIYREQRKREAIENRIKDDKPLADVIENMLKKSPVLSRLFKEGLRITSPFDLTGASTTDEYKGKTFPDYFQIIKEYDETNPKECPINRRFRIQFKTNASNDYFDRETHPGEFSLLINDEMYDNYSLNLWNGTAYLNVSIPDGARIGDVIDFNWTVDDQTRYEPFDGHFFIKITAPVTKPSGGGHGKKDGSSKENGNENKKPAGLSLPQIIEIRRKDWDEHQFNDETALKIIDDVYFVNMDNKYLLTELKATKENISLLENRFKFGLVFIGLAILNQHQKDEKTSPPGEDNGRENDDIFQTIEYSTKAIAPFLLPMIDQLGDITIEE